MLDARPSNQFKKDMKRLARRGLDMKKLMRFIEKTIETGEVSTQYRPHRLSGNWEGYWDCHLAPDWVVIYQIDDIALYLVQTGTHADLFK